MDATRSLHPPIERPLPDVTTERLHLRRFRADDLDALAAVFAKREVWEFPNGRGFTRDETEQFIARQISHWEEYGFGLWIATERATRTIVGYEGLAIPTFLPEVLPAVEVGWRYDPAVWGRGYATEGALAALRESFTTLGLGDVCSIPQSDNPRSARVAERIGMNLDRTVTIPANDRRGELEALLYRMTRDEWRARRE